MGVGQTRRKHQLAAAFKLLDKGGWDQVGGGSNNDPIEGGNLRPTIIPIAKLHLDVVIAEMLQSPLRLFEEFFDDLHGVDLGSQFGQDGRLISKTCADLENAAERVIRLILIGRNMQKKAQRKAK